MDTDKEIQIGGIDFAVTGRVNALVLITHSQQVPISENQWFNCVI
jgi:hypothetical protein